METFKEFLKHINQRISSPFLFSFAISWVICNWPVTIGLIFYDDKMLKVDGFDSYIRLIWDCVSWYSGFWLPVCFAALYTAVNPILSNGIGLFYTWVEKFADTKRLNILKGGKISVEKYLSLREELIKKGITLQEVIDKENSALTDLSVLEREKAELTSELNEVKSTLSQTSLKLEKEQDNFKSLSLELEQSRAFIVRYNSLFSLFRDEWICEFQFISRKESKTRAWFRKLYN